MEISKYETNSLKGVAIFLVVAAHIMGNYLGDYFGNYEYFLNVLGTGGVCVFFVLSGYGVYMSFYEKGITNTYWNNKFKKIFIPYWGVTIIYFIITRKVSFTILLKNLLFVDYERNIDGTMWYMSFLILWYLIFYLLYKFEIPDLFRICFLFIISGAIYENSYFFRGCGWQFQQNIISFPLGVLAASCICRLKRKIEIKKIVLYLMTLLIGILYVYGIIRNTVFQKLGIILVMFLILLIKTIIKSDLKCKAFYIVGTYSYFVYLIEGKILEILPRLQNAILNSVIYVLILVLIT